MTTYRRRPETVEAFHYEKALETMDFRYPFPNWLMETSPVITSGKGDVMITTPVGYLTARPGEWIVKDSRGNISVVAESVFDAKYEVVM